MSLCHIGLSVCVALVDRLPARCATRRNAGVLVADEKSGMDLLETVNNVLKDLSPKDHSVDVRDEPIERTAQRIFYFMPILKYDFQGDLDALQALLQEGAKEDFFYPLLHHMLSNLPQLRKRAYMAQYLTDFDLPEDMFADPEVMQKWQEHKELQTEFKETHKRTDQLKGSSVEPPHSLKNEVKTLEEEKGQLKKKISDLTKKLKKENENYDQLYDATSKLRKEQEQEQKLQQTYQEQSLQCKQAEARYYQSQKKLQEVQMNLSEGASGVNILERLEADVNMIRDEVEKKLPEQIQAKRQRYEEMSKLSNLPTVSSDELAHEEGVIRRLEQELQQKQNEVKSRAPAGGDGLSMYRQQAALVANKKEKAENRYKMLMEDMKTMEEDLDAMRKKMGHNVKPVLRGEEFKQYAEKLKDKVKEYKKKKSELSGVVAEKGILARTQDILKTRHGDQSAFLAQLEQQRGISGATALQEQMERNSEQMSEANKDKEMSLEDISRNVEEINNTIKEKKSKLAPLIKELRQVRSEFSTLESEYNEKKSLYESTAAGLDTERDKLTAEVTAYQDECNREESRYHYLNAMIESTKIILDRARLEDAGRNRVGESNQSYRELYQGRIQETENLSKKLREHQKTVKESHEDNLEQTHMFKDLRKVLACKIQVLKREVADSQSTTTGGGNMMVMD